MLATLQTKMVELDLHKNLPKLPILIETLSMYGTTPSTDNDENPLYT